MRRKIQILFLILGFAITSCSSKMNNELYEFVSQQEHDSSLFGWWKPANPDNLYSFFDGDSFRVTFASMGQDGTLQNKVSSTFWYTFNGKLYYVREATPVTGPIKSNYEYKFSDDGNTILVKDSENWIDWYYKESVGQSITKD